MSMPFTTRSAIYLASTFVAAMPVNALNLRTFSPTAHLRMNNFPAAPTVNPAFLNPGGAPATALDLSGIGWSVEEAPKQFTLVSPRHFVGANHFRPAVGSTVKFLARDNSLHTLTIAAIHTLPNADASPSDVFLGEFTSELPATAQVLPLPYLNLATEAAYTGKAIVIAGQAARGGRGTIGGVSDFGGDPITSGAGITTRAFTFTYNRTAGSVDDCHAEVGDSGSPSFVIQSGKAALVGTHTAILNASFTTTTYDTLVPHYVPEINALMEITGLHLRKASPPATSFSVSATATTATVRAGKPFTYHFSITNGAAAAENVTASLMLPAGAVVSSISAPAWFATSALSIRRGGLGAAEVTEFDVTFASAPAPGPNTISLDLKSDGSAPQNFSFSLNVLPSFTQWAVDLQDPSTTGDSDQDGIQNLVEYATGGDPQSNSQTFPGGGPSESLLPIFSANPLRLSYLRRTDAATRGLSYLLETSTNLESTSWQALEGLPTSVLASPGLGFEKIEATLPASSAEKSFYRLHIELAE